MPSLAEIYSDVLTTVFAFRAASPEDRGDYDSVRADLTDRLATARHQGTHVGGDPQEHALYAVVALVDETMMTAEWSGSERWRKEPLQVQLFGRFLAGEQFFERLDDLQSSGSSGANPDLLDIYFTCLCAGFRGMYRDDPHALSNRRRKLFQQLNTADLQDRKHLTEEAYGRELQRELLRSHFPYGWLVPFFGMALALYVAYYVVLTRQVGHIVELASRP